MKIKIKLSLIVIAIVVVVAGTITIILLNRASNIILQKSFDAIGYPGDKQAEHWEGRENRHFEVIRTLAAIMGDFENTEPLERRDLNDDILLAALKSQPNIMRIAAIFKPNAVDGMDSRFIGRLGSTATGQYAMTWGRDTGEIVATPNLNIQQTMDHLNSPNARNDRVEQPQSFTILGKPSYVFRLGVPIINSINNEVVGSVTCLLTIDGVQPKVEMNAAIEAAHAGEAGKGFAVVAGEIRKLAESSSTQSKTIGTVLKKIAESITKITGSTDNVLHRFEAIDSGVKTVADQEENIRNAMEEQGEGSKQVLHGVGGLNEITQNVRSSSEEMLNGSQEVIREGQNLEKVTQEITGGMNEMSTGADQINLAVNNINEMTTKNREAINDLLREVSRFKVE